MSVAFDPERVLSGESGIVEGLRRRTRGRLRDIADDAAAWLTLQPLRVGRAANRLPRRSVLVLGIYAPRRRRRHAPRGHGAARPPP